MVHGPYATVDGRATRYLEAGRGRPLILLHAFPLSADMWQEDTVTPAADAELLAGSIPGTELVVLPRVGHISNLEAPEDLSGALTRFLARAF